MGFQGKFLTRALDSIRLSGTIVAAAIAGTTDDIKVLIYDGSDDVLLATGTDVPSDDTAGYAKGCLFVDTDVAAATTGLYVNVGTTSDCDFDAVSDA